MGLQAKKKCRQYSVEYLSYGFITLMQDDTIPLCLICKNTLTNDSMRPSKLLRHLETKHPDKRDKPLEYFKKLREQFQKKPSIKQMLTEKVNKLDKGLVASYEISNLIAKSGKPHTIAETLIIPAISIVLSTVMDRNAYEIIQNIPLSNSSVSRRIDEMANNVEEQLIAKLRVNQFALQIDESTLRGNEALLLAYVRFLDKDQLIEEMLFARLLKTDTRGETIYAELNGYFKEKNIPLRNIIACATDGAAAMTGKYKGFVTFLKNAVPDVFCIHCVIHREHLISKKLGGRLCEALSIVIKTVNSIKSNAFQDRLFQQFCENNDEDFKLLVLHTEVRWLSKGNCLRRFVILWDSITSFIEDHQYSEQIIAFKNDIFYLSDIFEKLNVLNKQLQGKNCNLITAKGFIKSFMNKLKVFWMNIGRREFSQFPSLESLKVEIKDDDINIYVNHLKNLWNDMESRFCDILKMDIPEWVIDPFGINAVDMEITLQETIIELQNDCAAQIRFKNNRDEFWANYDLKNKYPHLWGKAQLFIVAFPTSYLVECGFSRVLLLLTKQRNRMDIVQRGDLRLSLTSLQPNIEDISKSHQAQGSH